MYVSSTPFFLVVALSYPWISKTEASSAPPAASLGPFAKFAGNASLDD